MKRSDISLNQWVIYQGRPDGPREDGTVVSLHALERGLASVLYRGDTTAKATYISDLTPGEAPVTFQPKPPPLAASAPQMVRQHALELLTEVRYDPDGFKPRGFMERNEPQRSAWRTFRLAEDRAARLSARATLSGSGTALLWAEVFEVLSEYKDRALSMPFYPMKRG